MKNRLNKSTIILLLIAIIATGVMGISSYFVRNQGNQELAVYVNETRMNDAQSFDENTLRDVFSQTMVGYYELKKAQDPKVEPYDVFITDGRDENTALRKSLSEFYSTTVLNPNNTGVYLRYLIQDAKTEKTISNDTSQNLTALLNTPSMESYPWYILFSFDSQGTMSVTNYSFLGEEYPQGYAGSNQRLIELYNRTLENSGGYAIRSELGETSTALVKDTTFLFAIDQATIDNQNRAYSSNSYEYDMHSSIAMPICNLIFIILALAVLLSNIKAEEIPFYKVVRKIPYEVHVIISLCIFFSLVGSYGILYYLATTFFSVETLWRCTQMGFIYLYAAYVILLIKDSYVKKLWKPNFIIRNVMSYITSVDLTNKNTLRVLLLVFINCVIMMIFISMQFVGVVFAFLYSIVIFFVAAQYLNKTQRDYKNLLDVTKDISTGDFNTDIDKNLGIFNDFKNDIVDIRANFKHAVEEEVHSQKMKTELISNVSHDLKTPLTSIITYTDLLKKEDISEKERKKYLNTLDRNAIRLKHLIEDLFEVSKANSGNIKLEKMEIDICSLMMQVQVELADKFTKAKLDIRNDFASEKIICFMDPQKTYRIFENLLTNITKYAMPSTRVYINIIENEKSIEISLRNISATELNFKAEDITERFMRGDKSRNTEGSGLGLAIAKTFSELHDGKLDITIDGDLFKVILQFPKINKPTTLEQPQE